MLGRLVILSPQMARYMHFPIFNGVFHLDDQVHTTSRSASSRSLQACLQICVIREQVAVGLIATAKSSVNTRIYRILNNEILGTLAHSLASVDRAASAVAKIPRSRSESATHILTEVSPLRYP